MDVINHLAASLIQIYFPSGVESSWEENTAREREFKNTTADVAPNLIDVLKAYS